MNQNPKTQVQETGATSPVRHDDFEHSFRRDHPVIWTVTLIGPFLLTGGILLAMYLTQGEARTWTLVATGVATFFFFGRFVILGGTDGAAEAQLFFTPAQLFLLVVYLDLMTAILIAFHSEMLFRFPLIGSRLRALVEDGEFILATQPWMRRLTFVGLVAFVMFPLAATGSVGGSIFGRLLGLSRLGTFLGVTIGSILGSGVVYLGASWIGPYLDRSNPYLVVGGIVLVVAIILLLNWRYRQLKNQHLARVRENDGASG